MLDVAQRTARLTRRRPAAASLVVVLVLAVMLEAPGIGLAAPPSARSAAEFLSARRGGEASDFALVYERPARVAGETLWAGKLVDRRSGRIELVYRDVHGTYGGAELPAGLRRAEEARQGALERKASRPLRDAVAAAGAAPHRLPVAVWLSADVTSAERSVIDRHPEVTWLEARPLAGDLSTIRELRGEMWRARRDAYVAATADLQQQLHGLGGAIAYASTSAPLVFVDLPAPAVAALAARSDVLSLGLEGRWEPAMSTAGPTVEANWTTSSADRGTGVRVAVVEYHNVHRSGDLAGKVVASHSTSGTLAYASGGVFDHPTWVAGAVAGQSSGYPGIAPGALIVSSGTGGYSASLTYDRRVIAAADWAIAPRGGDSDIVNTSLVQDTATGAEEARRYFDSLVYQDGRLAISAAGNYVNFNGWQIGSPGTGYNVLTVGGVDDRGTSGRGDDRLWYVPGSNGSNWLDRPGDPWNTHGDYNKPNLVAPAVGVRTANGLAASGTSVATPIVAGVAAQLLANEPVLAAWPEGARAVLMAGAVHRVPMPDGSRNLDHEGVGMTSAYWTNLIAAAGDQQFGGYRIGSLQAGAQTTQQVSVRAGDRLRVALAWSSHTGGSSDLSKTDVLRSDLDLRVTAPDGSVIGSYTMDNAYEFVEFAMPSTGSATIEVLQSRFDSGSEPYGLAWAKVRDATPPRMTVRAPADEEPWAVRTTQVRAVFNESVVGVGTQSLTLTDRSTGARISAAVSYSSSSRTATLQPAQPLAAGWYDARAGSGITDRAGNALRATTWSFRVAHAAPDRGAALERIASLSAGTHVGYRFDAGGHVADTKSLSYASARGAAVDRRALAPGMPGYWLRIASGGLSGFWVRESSRAALGGRVGGEVFDPDRRVILRAGTHVGSRFSGGSVTASRTYRAAGTVTVIASQRAVINGSLRLRISSGALAGYWVTESGSAYLPGALQVTDLALGQGKVAGSHTGYRYYASGAVRATKSGTLATVRTTLAAAWAIINGRPAFYLLNGTWAGHWLAESSSVHLP